jgi:hypothetical protein
MSKNTSEMKKSFSLLLTIIIVIMLSFSAIFILENMALNSTIDTKQAGYLQAQYHLEFCQDLILNKIDIDTRITTTIKFENIKNYNIKAIVKQKDENIAQIDLFVESLLYKNIRLHKRFDKSLI